MPEQDTTRALASWGMQYGLTSHELAEVVRSIGAGGSDDEIARTVQAQRRSSLDLDDARALVEQVRGLMSDRPAEVDAWLAQADD